MVNILLLLTIVVFVSVQQVTKKAYNLKVSGGAMSYSAASCVAALVVFLITSGGMLTFSTEFLPYSLLFALSYSVTVVTGMLAIMVGPVFDLPCHLLFLDCSHPLRHFRAAGAGQHQSVYRPWSAGGSAGADQSGREGRKEDHPEVGHLCDPCLCGQRYVLHGAKGAADPACRPV